MSERDPKASDWSSARRPADRLARWLPVGLAAILGVFLVVAVLLVRSALNDAASLATRDQAESYTRMVRAALRSAGGKLTDDDLAGLIEEQGEHGLRYLGLRSAAGRSIASAGEAEGAESWIEGVYTRGGRVRSVTLLGGGGRGPRWRNHAPRHRRPFRRVLIAVEFEPVVADDLRARADTVLWVALASVVALLALAVLLSRILAQRERLRTDQEARRQLAALGEMSAVLAHEIRNPLASLKGHAELLEELLAAESSAHAGRASRLVSSVGRLQGLTNDLLSFVRSGTIERRAIDPAALVRQTAAELMGDDAGERLVLETAGAPETHSLDPDRLRQALSNVIENALHATADGRRPAVTVGREGANLRISVRDHGPGIDPAERERIFEPFRTGKTRGTGLGLAVAKRIVELHGGTITAADHPDGGALFTILIPPGPVDAASRPDLPLPEEAR